MKLRVPILLLLIIWTFAACRTGEVDGAIQASPTPTSKNSIGLNSSLSVSPSPEQDILPTSTPDLVSLSATIWSQEPLVPILLYHYFIPDEQDNKDSTQIRLGNFRTQLEKLYDAGYSLVQVEDWLSGYMVVPEGRRPLAITIDDLFVSNQLEFDDDGNPSLETGLGVLWQFSQEHSDFGFEVMLFVNLGEKSYSVIDPQERRLKQANAVIWCMEHGARIYNHTFSHIDLQYSSPEELESDLTLHDTYLREILTQVGRDDLIPELGNMLAVPYSWPVTELGYQVMHAYKTPEGIQMQAVFGSAYFKSASPLQPPYTPGLDPYNIKRFEVNNDALNYLVNNQNSFPSAQACSLTSVDIHRTGDSEYLAQQVELAVKVGSCPPGIIVMAGFIFDARSSNTTLLFP